MADALETAVIAMVLQGDAAVSQKSNQVTADLTSAERAGRAAETAAKNAESAVGKLQDQIVQVTHQMRLAVSVAERLAGGQGKNPGLDALGQGLSTGIATQRLVASFGVDAILPGASLVAGAAAGLYAGVQTYEKETGEQAKKDAEQADRIAKRIAEEQKHVRENDIATQLVEQAARAHLDHILGSRTVP